MGTLTTIRRKDKKSYLCLVRVGIATGPEKRKQYWQSLRPNLGWRIIASGLSYPDAQRKEIECARSDGCESHPGGQGIAGNIWSVYRFDY